MYKDLIGIFTPGLLAAVMVLFFAMPGFCQDNINSSGLRVRIFPIPQTMALIPMSISFNGVSDSNSDSFSASSSIYLEDSEKSVSKELQDFLLPPTGFSGHLNRIKAYLFQYINLAGTNIDDMDIGSQDNGDDKDISLEFQADVTDLSGALFIVMKL
jgi:hypothetical protein